MGAIGAVKLTCDRMRRIHLEPRHGGAADGVVDFAVAELRRCLERMTGGAPAVTAAAPGAAGDTIDLVLDPGLGLAGDGFRLRCTEQSLGLEASSPRGLLYAVYAFLERLGCLWVHPGVEEEIVPRLAGPVEIAAGEYTEVPLVEHRGVALYGLYAATVDWGEQMIDWMAKTRLNLLLTSWDRPDGTNTQTMTWPEVADRLLPELQRRGIAVDMSEHSTHCFMPSSLFEEHPDWFALVGGERRPGQMCYSRGGRRLCRPYGWNALSRCGRRASASIR